MCLAVPAKIMTIDGLDAQVNLQGAELSARLDLVEGVRVGDWILLHAGYAIQVLSEEEARETLELWEELAGAGE
jgi:hydrogenase expression/formation protein HypC